MKPAKQKKNTKYYLKKAAVSAIGAVAAASLLVNGLFPSAREITAGLPETPPAIVQVCEPELPEEQEEKAPEKKTRKQRFKEKLLSLPLWARSVLLLPLWGFGGAAVWLLKRILPGILGWLVRALLPVLLLLLALKLLFPDVPLSKLLCKRNRIALIVLAVLLFLTEPLLGRFFPEKEWIVWLTKTALLALTFTIACLQIQCLRRKKAVSAAGSSATA